MPGSPISGQRRNFLQRHCPGATALTGTVTINGGAAATNTTSVTLTTDAANAGRGFSNDGITFSAPEAIVAAKV